jgi:thermostable 8-oxoguanine DNA glycosylase
MEIDANFLKNYLDVYEKTQGVLPERLEEFGNVFRQQGHLTRDDLYEIAYESSTRSAYHVERNPRDVCLEVTENVLALEDERDDFSQIALLSSLHGFKAPTASCVTTALAPERHAVVDTRVWASLERAGRLKERKETFDSFDYCVMMDEIRDIAERTGYPPAEVGYALFAHDYDVREGTLH